MEINKENYRKMSTFQQAMMHVLKWEGGYVNHPNDPGGETKYGITKRSYPDLEIATLTVTDATQIYKRDFWDKYKIQDMPEKFRLIVFDMIVNMGTRGAALTIQRTVNNRIPGTLKEDGLLGPKTRNSLHLYEDKIEVVDLKIFRLKRYNDLLRANSKYSVFFRGWCKRALYVG